MMCAAARSAAFNALVNIDDFCSCNRPVSLVELLYISLNTVNEKIDCTTNKCKTCYK